LLHSTLLRPTDGSSPLAHRWVENIINIIKDIRLIDDQPPGRAVEHRGQLCGDDFDMGAERKQRRAKLAKSRRSSPSYPFAVTASFI
jgi:hypothetical protein